MTDAEKEIKDILAQLRLLKEDGERRKLWRKIGKFLYAIGLLLSLLMIHHDHLTIGALVESSGTLANMMAANAGVIVVNRDSRAGAVTDENWD